MAVVQLRAGIYVNSIEEVPAAEQTAAYKYASLFTKARKENWEMSQRQAASEIADAKVRDAAAIESYDAQIADYGDRLKQLDQDIARTGTDVAKANAATQRTALQEATTRQNNAILWEKAKVEGVVVPGGSRSSSSSSGTSTSSGGGGGGGGGRAATTEASDAVNTTIGSVGTSDPSALADAINAGPLDAAVISNTDPKVVTASKAGATLAAITNRAVEYRTAGYSEDESYDKARAEVTQNLNDGGHPDYVDALDEQEAIDLAGGGGRTSTSERSSQSGSVRDAATLQPRYPGLGTMPTADAVTAPTVAVDTNALEKKRKELADQLAELIKQGAPASQVDDFITRSREIMAGRFGRVAESPNFYQRNVAQAILSGRMTNQDIALLRSDYNKYKTGGGDGSGSGDGSGGGTGSAGGGRTSGGSGGGGTTGGGGSGDGTSNSQAPLSEAESQMLTDTSPPVRIPADRPVRIPADRLTRPEPGPTSSGITVTEGGSGVGPAGSGLNLPISLPGLKASGPRNIPSVMDVENLRLAQRRGLPPEILDAMDRLEKPASSTTTDGPRMQNPGGTIGTVGPFMPGFGDPTPNIGSKPEAVGDFSIPDVPSVYNDRPFDPVTNPYGRGNLPPNKDYPPIPGEGSGLTFKSTYITDGLVPMSDFEREQLIKLKQKSIEENKRKQREIDDAEDAKKKGKSGSTLEYFKGRFDSAKQIIDQPGKLARLTASGPGKVAADVYNANKTTGKDFKLTYDTLTATYEDDKEALATAHQVALALDIASRARTAPPKA